MLKSLVKKNVGYLVAEEVRCVEKEEDGIIIQTFFRWSFISRPEQAEWLSAGTEGVLATIIDPISCKVIPREKYWDNESGEWKARICLRAGEYFVFKIMRDGSVYWK